MLSWTNIDTPLGRVQLTSEYGYLSGCFFETDRRFNNYFFARSDLGVFDVVEGQLKDYFAGDFEALDEVRDYSLLSSTFFEQAVLNYVAKYVHAGQTVTYSEIAAELGSKDSVRAVGNALAKNPLCLIYPCHRVIPKSGGIGNYAGGQEIKLRLLNLEK